MARFVYFSVYNNMRDYKLGLKCLDCSESDPACLDFHHLIPAYKVLEVSKMIRGGYSEGVILQEIAKCSVLCSSCHRKFHSHQREAQRLELLDL